MELQSVSQGCCCVGQPNNSKARKHQREAPDCGGRSTTSRVHPISVADPAPIGNRAAAVPEISPDLLLPENPEKSRTELSRGASTTYDWLAAASRKGPVQNTG